MIFLTKYWYVKNYYKIERWLLYQKQNSISEVYLFISVRNKNWGDRNNIKFELKLFQKLLFFISISKNLLGFGYLFFLKSIKHCH